MFLLHNVLNSRLIQDRLTMLVRAPLEETVIEDIQHPSSNQKVRKSSTLDPIMRQRIQTLVGLLPILKSDIFSPEGCLFTYVFIYFYLFIYLFINLFSS
jgi:hypothetical protein